MASSLSYELQDGGVLLVVANKYQAELIVVGSTEADTRHLETVIASLTQKDIGHEQAQNQVAQLTREQNVLIKRSWNEIGKIRAAAKVEFYGDKTTQKEFHVGVKTHENVAETLTELAYVKSLTTTYATRLATRGIGETDATEITTCYSELQAKDAGQENAKRTQVALRNERDVLLKDLLDSKRKIRGSAAICFRGNPDILNEFKPLSRKSTTRKSDTTDTSSDTATETPSAG